MPFSTYFVRCYPAEKYSIMGCIICPHIDIFRHVLDDGKGIRWFCQSGWKDEAFIFFIGNSAGLKFVVSMIQKAYSWPNPRYADHRDGKSAISIRVRHNCEVWIPVTSPCSEGGTLLPVIFASFCRLQNLAVFIMQRAKFGFNHSLRRLTL